MAVRIAEIKRVLERSYRGTVEKPKKGSHWKARNAAGVLYPLPAHNGLKTEVGDVYLKKMCEAFGIDLSDFRSKL